MKKYGIMLADNGSAWFISGKPDARWNNDNLQTLGQLLGSNFEAVDATVLRIDPNSGAAIQSGVTVTVSPSSAAVRTGRSQTFTATVTGAPGTVTWSVNDIAGGDAVVGTIDASGRYVAPVCRPESRHRHGPRNEHCVTDIVGQFVGHDPSDAEHLVGQPVARFGRQLHPDRERRGLYRRIDGLVRRRGTADDGAVFYTAEGYRQRAGREVLGAGRGEHDRRRNVQRISRERSRGRSSHDHDLAHQRHGAGEKDAAVHRDGSEHARTPSVTWKVNGITGGNSTVGTISASGLYRAPNSPPNPAVVTVSATAAADQTKTANASVTITRR